MSKGFKFLQKLGIGHEAKGLGTGGWWEITSDICKYSEIKKMHNWIGEVRSSFL